MLTYLKRYGWRGSYWNVIHMNREDRSDLRQALIDFEMDRRTGMLIMLMGFTILANPTGYLLMIIGAAFIYTANGNLQMLKGTMTAHDIDPIRIVRETCGYSVKYYATRCGPTMSKEHAESYRNFIYRMYGPSPLDISKLSLETGWRKPYLAWLDTRSTR